MARILGLFPSALIAARNGMSASAWYQQLRSQGLAPRRGEAYELFKVAKGVVTRTGAEPFAPVEQVPSGADIGQWPSKNATGIVQTVALAYRDKVTGQVATTWWKINTPQGITRQTAINMAIDAYSAHTEEYGQDLIGAIHTSAYRLVPFGA